MKIHENAGLRLHTQNFGDVFLHFSFDEENNILNLNPFNTPYARDNSVEIDLTKAIESDLREILRVCEKDGRKINRDEIHIAGFNLYDSDRMNFQIQYSEPKYGRAMYGYENLIDKDYTGKYSLYRVYHDKQNIVIYW